MKIRKNRELDKITAEKLLSGSFSPDDIPSEFTGLARLFEAARAVETDAADYTGLIEKMSEVIESSNATTARSFAKQGGLIMPRLRRLKLSALGAAAALSLMTGLAFAGSLPSPAQEAVANVAALFGLDIPAGDHYDEAIDRRDAAKTNGDGATAGERNGGASASDVSGQAQDVDTLGEAADLAHEASGGNSSVTGTSTAQEAATTGTTTSSEAPSAEDHPGEEAASDGAANQDRSPR